MANIVYSVQSIPGVGLGVVRESEYGKYLVDIATTEEQARKIIDQCVALETLK